ncbi:MAG: hypothetical protein ACQR33_04755 [Candidatus Saccharibacteria bacterium]
MTHDDERGSTLVHIPDDMPFTAASLECAIQVLGRALEASSAAAKWTAHTGMVIDFSGSRSSLVERAEQALLPPGPKQTPRDRAKIEFLFVDSRKNYGGVIDPAQALTGLQLRQFFDDRALTLAGHPRVERLIPPYTVGSDGWRMGLHYNCLTVESMANILDGMDRSLLELIIQPQYDSDATIEVRIEYDDMGRTGTAKIVVTKAAYRTENYYPYTAVAARNLPGITNAWEEGRSAIAAYEGPLVFTADPSKLVMGFVSIARQVAKAMGVHPELSGNLRVVLLDGGMYDPLLGRATRLERNIALASNR